MRRPFEIFARAESAKYLDRIKVIFGYSGLEDFKALCEYINRNAEAVVPRWEFDSPNVSLLMNVEKLDTQR